MVPANKILTVAYGTFSCTLEGFDDPFSTMTDIAEYFRGLAAEDRYFGAEPPTPDMAMLRKIAETTTRRAVDAQSDGTGVTLRPSAAAQAQTAPDQETDVAAAALVQDVSPPEVYATAQAGAAEQEPPLAAEAEAESAAAKLARIRDVVAAERATDDYSEDEHASEPPEIETPQIDTSSETPETGEDRGAPITTSDAPLSADAETDAEDETDTEVADAGVEEQAEDVPMDEDYEDLVATTDDLDGEDTLNADLAALFANEDLVDDSAEPETSAEIASRETDTIADDNTADVENPVPPAPADTSEEEPQAIAPEPEAKPEAPQAAIAPRRIRVRKVRRAAEGASATAIAAAAAASAVRAPDPVPEASATPHDGPGPSQAMDTTLPDDDEVELMQELAAIEAELGRDATGRTAVADADQAGDENLALDDEDEDEDEADDLMAELAAIRASESSETPPAPTQDTPAKDLTEASPENAEVPAATSDEAPKPAIEEAAAAESEPKDLERLFAATASRLSGKDTSRRHANISHLKAAVAARRADDSMETVKSDQTGAYRNDLANTVRPRRAEKAPPAQTARPERPTPLVLISEQRVEQESAPEAVEPVVPRRAPRVSDADARAEAELEAMRAAGGSHASDMGDDFEQFAQDVGAADLADVLEAAAVYSATVMGQDTFSRPRLLHLAAEAVDDLSREDGLRGFGQLLRDGTLRKVSRGTFALGTESRFREQAKRRAG